MFYITSVSTFCSSNERDDAKRNEGLETPEGIQRFDDILYGVDPNRNRLDVYRPKNTDRKLPVIISIHGGGWVYGNKHIMQFYCMSLAEHGFAVVNFSYRLAPEHKHPTPLVDTNTVFQWVLDHADAYGFDTDHIFAVGDSVGANILGLYCRLCTDSDYAKALSIQPPKGALPRAVALNSGLYRLERGEELLLDNLASEYFPSKGTDAEYEEIDLGKHVNAAFPPSFVMTAKGDFLVGQAKPFCDLLQSYGVHAEYHCYGTDENPLKHVFHIDIKLPEARKCNKDECAFFSGFLKAEKGGSSK